MTRIVRPEPYWLVAGGLVLADQLTKALIGGLDEPVAIGNISLGRAVNPGGVFGLDLSNEVLIGIGTAICVALLAALATGAGRPPVRLGGWLLLAGAFSNTLDRIVHGGVVDIIAINGFARFNLADALIVLGALSLLRAVWWREGRYD